MNFCISDGRRWSPKFDLEGGGARCRTGIEQWVEMFMRLILLFQDYQVDLYLRQRWFDPRLNHPQLLEPLDLNDPNLVKAIWKPEVYFPNAKDAEFQYVTV